MEKISDENLATKSSPGGVGGCGLGGGVRVGILLYVTPVELLVKIGKILINIIFVRHSRIVIALTRQIIGF